MILGLSTVYNCQQFTNQLVGLGTSLFNRCVLSLQALQSKYRFLSDIQI